MMPQQRFRLSLGALLLVSVGCFQPSEQRAERDLDVGKATGGGVRVVVAGGHAAIRSLSSGKVILWASAPELDLDVQVDAAAQEQITLEIRNAMPTAQLEAVADGEAIEPIVESTVIPTRKRWTLKVEPPVTLSLRVVPSQAELKGPFRFAMLSDIQEAIDRVGEIFQRIDATPDLSFVWTSGDLTQRGSGEQMDPFQRELESLSIPLFGTLGNHDAFQAPTPWHGRFGRCNEHFWYRGVAFTAVDSADGTVDPLVYDWLDGWLAEARHSTHVFTTHIPILDPIGVRGGGFASRNEAAKLLALLARGRVDATFYGHIHSYYAFENAGIPAYISGGGGAIPERFDGIGRHFLVVTVDPLAGLLGVERVDVD